MYAFRTVPMIMLLVLSPAVRANIADIVERSPFIWPGFNEESINETALPASVDSSQFEFHAVYQLSGKTYVLLKNRSTSEFSWQQIGVADDGVLPSRYNADSNSLVLSVNNEIVEVSLQSLPEWKATAIAGATAATRSVQRTPSIQSTSPSQRTVARTSPFRTITSSRGTTIQRTTGSGSPPPMRTTQPVPRIDRRNGARPAPEAILNYPRPDNSGMPENFDMPEPEFDPPEGAPPAPPDASGGMLSRSPSPP